MFELIFFRTLLYIMREMIQTERDYVNSLDYVIENYIPELMREDIPQALRGQRNVIFGNVEKIYEFHSQYFLRELEQCETNPLQVGQIFLKHDKKFYLYALYNKNKPKSDALMSEYGSTFFKVKKCGVKNKAGGGGVSVYKDLDLELVEKSYFFGETNTSPKYANSDKVSVSFLL